MLFDKILKKVEDIAGDAIGEIGRSEKNLKQLIEDKADDIINSAGRSAEKSIFEKAFDKVSNATEGSLDYLVQVEKLSQEKFAKEFGITSREFASLSQKEKEERFGLTKAELEKRAKNNKAQNDIIKSAEELKTRAEKERLARKTQAMSIGMEVEDFDKLTLSEQADKLSISLDALLIERALDF